jgi:hypothetical protein
MGSWLICTDHRTHYGRDGHQVRGRHRRPASTSCRPGQKR